jgi:L-fuculose-phosphate aldolase
VNADELADQMITVARDMRRQGLVFGTAGNLGARRDDGRIVLTPSTLDYDEMTRTDLVVCDPDGTVVDGERAPTSERALHLQVLARHPDVGATLHCHARHATMFALARQPIPAVLEEFVVHVGGDVPVAEYRPTGSDELGDEVASHLGDRSAVLMANHGLFTIGKTPRNAFHVAALVERTAEIVLGARLLGELHDVPPEIQDRFARFYRFGRGLAP